MIFRGQNYLSNAIRRVGSDVAGLSRLQQLQMTKGQAQLAAERIRTAKLAAQREVDSLKAGGKARLALERTMANNATSIQRSELRRRDAIQNAWNARRATQDMVPYRQSVTRRAAIEQAWQARNKVIQTQGYLAMQESELARLRAAKKSTAAIREGIAASQQRLSTDQEAYNQARRNMSEVERGYAAQEAAANRAYTRRRARVGIETGQLGAQKLGQQQLLAQEADMERRVKAGEQSVLNYTRAWEMANIRVAQADAMLRAQRFIGIQNAARQVEHLSRFMQMLGVISAATFGFMAKSAADFNTQATVAATQSTTIGHNTVAQVQANAAKIGDAIQKMLLAGRTIAKPEELQRSIYDIFSGVTLKGGQQAQLRQGVNLLKEFNRVVTANAGLVDLNEVTQAGITIMNDFGVSAGNVRDKLNYMQASVRFGRMTMREFLSTFNQAAPAAKAAGYSFESMADAITFLSRKFPSIRMAATGYARLVEVFSRGRTAFKEHGIAVTDATGRLLPLEQIVQNLTKVYPGLTKGTQDWATVLKEITGTQATIQARRVGVFFAQDQRGYHNLSKQVRGDNNELTKSLEAVQKSTGVTWAEFVNQLRAVILEVGAGAIPAFQKFGKYIADAIKWFSNLSPHTKRLIGYIGGLVSVLVLLGSTLTAVVGGIIAMGAGVAIWRTLNRSMKPVLRDTEFLAVAQDRVTKSSLRMRMAGEAGFIAPGASLALGLTAAIPLIIAYHSQLTSLLRDMGGWRQLVILFSAAILAIKMGPLIQGFMGMSIAARGLMGAAGLLGLVAVMTNFAGSAELARKGLDAWFSGWAGWVGGLAVATTAVYKLRAAIIELEVISKVQMAFTALKATVASMAASFTLARNASIAVGETRAVAAGTGAMVAARTAATGLGVGVAGLGAAIGSLVPALAVGGALIGGLYLWKRHLDAVHDAQKRVAEQEAFIERVVSGSKLLDIFGRAGGRTEDQTRAQIAYNQAFSDLQGILRNVNASQLRALLLTGADLTKYLRPDAKIDDLRTQILNLADAERALHRANVQLNASLRAGTGLSQLTNQNQRVAGLRNTLRSLQQIYKNLPRIAFGSESTMPINKLPGMNLSDQQKTLLRNLGIDNANELKSAVNRYIKLVDVALAQLDTTNQRFHNKVTGYVRSLMQLRMLPTASSRVINGLANWIQRLGHLPTVKEIRVALNAMLFLQNPANIPVQFAQKARQIIALITSGQAKRLTKKQIDFLLKFVFRVDPKSDKGAQLQAIIQGWMKAAVDSIPPDLAKALGPGSVLGQWQDYLTNQAKQTSDAAKKAAKATPPPRTTHTPTITQAAKDQRELAQIQRQTAELGRLYQKASHSKQGADWLAFNRKLETYEKQHKGAMLDVFQQLLNDQESAEKKSQRKRLDAAKKAARERLKAEKDAQKEITQAAQTLQQQYQSMYQQNQQSFGTIFQGPFVTGAHFQERMQWGHKLTGQDLLQDLKAQVFQFRQWRNLLRRLRRSGIPFALYQQIVAAGPGSINEVRALLSLSPAELRQYYQVFDRGQKMIQQATQADMKIQLRQYRHYGRQIALAIIQGLRDEQTPMLNYFKNLIKEMFPGLAAKAGGRASTTTRGTAGRSRTDAAGRVPRTPPRTPRTRINPTPDRRLQGATTRAASTVRVVQNNRTVQNTVTQTRTIKQNNVREIIRTINRAEREIIRTFLRVERERHTIHQNTRTVERTTTMNRVRNVERNLMRNVARHTERTYMVNTVRTVTRHERILAHMPLPLPVRIVGGYNPVNVNSTVPHTVRSLIHTVQSNTADRSPSSEEHFHVHLETKPVDQSTAMNKARLFYRTFYR